MCRVSSEVGITSGGSQMKKSAQAEREIRYFVEVSLESLCVEWALILAVLLLDTSVFGRGVECVSTHAGVLDRDTLTSCLQGVEELYEWAETDCPGYLPFLESVQTTVEQLDGLLQTSPETPATIPVSSVTMEETHMGGFSADEQAGKVDEHTPSQSDSEQSESACVIA